MKTIRLALRNVSGTVFARSATLAVVRVALLLCESVPVLYDQTMRDIKGVDFISERIVGELNAIRYLAIIVRNVIDDAYYEVEILVRAWMNYIFMQFVSRSVIGAFIFGIYGTWFGRSVLGVRVFRSVAIRRCQSASVDVGRNEPFAFLKDQDVIEYLSDLERSECFRLKFVDRSVFVFIRSGIGWPVDEGKVSDFKVWLLRNVLIVVKFVSPLLHV